MARTTAKSLREIMTTELGDEKINAFIEDVDLWITEVVAPATPVQSAQRLEIIARYLTCAMIRLRELTGSTVSSVSVGDASESYQLPGEVKDYLDTAAGFDATGLVRANFLAPRPTPQPIPWFAPVARVGKGYSDDSSVT